RLAIVVLILVATYAASIMGPPPSSVRAIGAGTVGFLLLVAALAAWADRPSVRGEPVAAAHPVR
ncbi:MAG: hypothetical protein M3Q93_00575, partial [Gemmatimonadota bacterium]|nr:hypothetical protein [Gemmatimonadota bacterium]